MAARIAMMAITTSSSIRVKAGLREYLMSGLLCCSVRAAGNDSCLSQAGAYDDWKAADRGGVGRELHRAGNEHAGVRTGRYLLRIPPGDRGHGYGRHPVR